MARRAGAAAVPRRRHRRAAAALRAAAACGAAAACAPAGAAACSVLGVVPLPDCPPEPCAAVTDVGGAIASGLDPDLAAVAVACVERAACVDELFLNPVVIGIVPDGVTADSLCSAAAAAGPAPAAPTGGNASGNGTAPEPPPVPPPPAGPPATPVPKVRSEACRAVRGCVSLQCRTPLSDSFECEDCYMEGAQVFCESEDKEATATIVGGVAGAVAGLSAVALVAFCFTRGAPPGAAEQPAAPPQQPAGAEPGAAPRRRTWAPEVDPSDAAPTQCFSKYRIAYLLFMRRLGGALVQHRGLTLALVLLPVVFFAAGGLPFFEIARPAGAGMGIQEWIPADTDLSKQLDLVDKWTDPFNRQMYFYVLVGPRDGGNALTKKYLEDMLKINNVLLNITVPVVDEDGVTHDAGWGHFCFSLDNPLVDTFLGVGMGKPCINPGVLDCFFEGNWEFVNNAVKSGNLKTAYTIVSSVYPGMILQYDDRPSFRDITDEEMMTRMQNVSRYCEHWAQPLALPRDKMFGGNNGGLDTKMTFAKRIITHSIQYAPAKIPLVRPSLSSITERSMADAQGRWYDALEDALEQMDGDTATFPDTSISCFFSVSVERMLKEIGQTAVLNIIVGYALMWFFIVISQVDLADASENHWNLGLACFVLVCISNLGAFGFISLVGLHWNHTMLQALPFLALGLGVDDVFVLLHYFRAVPGKDRSADAVIADLLEKGGASVTLTSLSNITAFLVGTIIPIPALRDFLLSAGIVVIFNIIIVMTCVPILMSFQVDRLREKARNKPEAQAAFGCGMLQSFVSNSYSPVAQRMPIRIALCSVFSVLFIVSCIGLTSFAKMRFGFEITDLVPRGSYLAKGFKEMYLHVYAQHENQLYLTAPWFDIPNRQVELLRLHDELVHTKWSAYAAGNTDALGMWVTQFLEICDEHGKLDKADADDATTWICDPESFYKIYHTWRNPDTGGLGALMAQITDAFGYKYGLENYTEGNTLMLSVMNWGLNMRELTTSDGHLDPDKWVEHIDDMKRIIKKHVGSTDDVFALGFEYAIMEEFVQLRYFFWMTFTACVVAVMFAGLLVPVSWRGAPLIALSAAATTIELCVVMMLAGLNFSSMTAVVLIMSIGLSVEFSAHVVVAFEVHPGSRTERLDYCIKRTFIPIVEGSLSSFLAIILLAFSPFPYIVKYWFLPFIFAVLIEMVHTLFFLPAILSIIGTGEGVAECCAGAKAVSATTELTVKTTRDGEYQPGETGGTEATPGKVEESAS